MTELQLPAQAPEAEEAVLGSMLIESWAARRGLQMLRLGDFYEERHRLIFEAIERLAGADPRAAVDLVTVVNELRRMDRLGKAGGPTHVQECQARVASTEHLEYYIRHVREASLQRQIDQGIEHLRGDRTPEKIKELGDLILSLQGNRGGSIFDMRQDLGPMIDEMFKKPEPGIGTGIESLDFLMGPLKPGDLWTVGARPGGGKTALMLRLAGELASMNVETLYLTTEMRVKELVQRILPMATGIPHSKFRAASFTKEDMVKVLDACNELQLLPLRIFQRGRLRLEDIRGAVFQAKPQVVFIDYLQRCVMPRAENMAYQIGEFYADLKSFLLDVGCIGFIGCQTDRELDRNPTEPPQLVHLKGSGAIEAESDGVGMLWEPPREVIEKRVKWVPPSPGCRALEFIIRKNRNGDKNVKADLELNGQLIKICERREALPASQEEMDYADQGNH